VVQEPDHLRSITTCSFFINTIHFDCTTAGEVLNEGEQRVMIGAASRGIIQKEFQHDAKIYKTAYEKNPFDKVNAEELDEYTQQFGAGHRADTDTSEGFNSTLNDSMQIEDPVSPDGSYCFSFSNPLFLN
jgi:hypothetical protein